MGAPKLTPELVWNIRQEGKAGKTQREIARKYFVTAQTVGRILREESWPSQGDVMLDYDARRRLAPYIMGDGE